MAFFGAPSCTYLSKVAASESDFVRPLFSCFLPFYGLFLQLAKPVSCGCGMPQPERKRKRCGGIARTDLHPPLASVATPSSQFPGCAIPARRHKKALSNLTFTLGFWEGEVEPMTSSDMGYKIAHNHFVK